MKNHLLAIIFVVPLIFSGCNKESMLSQNEAFSEFSKMGKPDKGGGDDPQPTGAWNLIFEDEFNSDFSAWNIWEGGAFNEEIQLYRGEQLELSNGTLKINIQREAVTGPTNIYDSTPKDFEYVSGRIETKALFGPSAVSGEREYRFEARIKLPSGHGMWPAFWSYGDPWPTQGEIDILEARGGEPTEYQSNIFYGRRPNRNINRNTEVHYSPGVDLTADFHVYEMRWRSNEIDILFDGQVLHTYVANRDNNIASIFGKKEKVVLNTAVGGLFFQDRNSANYADNAQMEIDWVRVYNRADE
ncbi:glycoside hydrolase family 16 protein [Portibacter marinus]|uniref:glycoside hydrolase family 16 protein n=1 Tax=Portibacter marinus TaxID=2898660 RepID=UPI001F2BA397|nr:glycoside hydrolase family 16 protein [Portibacter marinus]